MVRKGCLPLFVLGMVVMILPVIDGRQHTNHPWKCFQCQPGYFIIQDCNSFMSTQCAPCPAGTYTSGFNRLFQCKRCNGCPTGHRQIAPCNQAHDTKCVLSPLLKKIHDTAGYQGDEQEKPEGHVTESPIETGSGDVSNEKESRFSSVFANGKVGYVDIPDLSKVEKTEESYQDELSGDTPMKPMLFDLDSFLPRQVERNASVRSSTEEPAPTTVSVSTDVTTDLLPESEAAMDDLIRIEETKAGAQMTTAAADVGAEGSATFTLSLEELPEVSTETPVQTESETSLEPETESFLDSTLGTTLDVHIPDTVTKAIVDTFNEINEPIKPSVAVSNVSETVNAAVVETTAVVTSAATSETNAAPVEVTTTSAETTVTSTTEKPSIVPEVGSESDSEDEEDSESDSREATETTASTVTKSDAVAPTTLTSASASDASTTDTVTVPSTTVLLKRIIVPEGETIDEDAAGRNKTPIAKVIPLEKAKGHLSTTGMTESGSTSKDTFTPAGAPAIPTDITTPQHTYPWINGSELLQEPAVDNSNAEDSKHVDVAIAAVITGVGLIVLAVIAVRYCVKKRTFKDMRRAQDRIRIQLNEAKGLKRKDSQTEESLQTAINDDIELQAINGGAKHMNGKANGHCKDANGSAGKHEIMSAVNCNYKAGDDDTKNQSNVMAGDSALVGDLYAVPNKLVVTEPAEPLLNDKSKSTDQGETTATPGFTCLDILDNIKYIDDTTDEEGGEYVMPIRTYLRQATDNVYSSAEDLLLQTADDLDAIAEESTPMLRRTSDNKS